MTSRIKDDIKAFFETGDKPTQSQFVDFIDSYVDMAGPMGTLQAQVSAGGAGAMVAGAGTASIATYAAIRASQGITVYTTALATGVVGGLVATTAQAVAGTDSNTIVTPQLVAAAIAALTPAGGSTLKFVTSSAGLTLDATHNAKIVQLTGSTGRTFAFTAAATLADGWWCVIQNNSTAELTVDPNSSELIDGLATYIMYPGEVRMVQCTGSAFNTVILNGGTATFTSSGTWQRPPGYSSFEVEIISGGGNGASRTTSGNAGGGGGGACVDLILPSGSFVAAGSTETVTVAGTLAGVSGSSNGGVGNNSSLTINGITFTVSGGSTGTIGATAASGNPVTGGDGGSPLMGTAQALAGQVYALHDASNGTGPFGIYSGAGGGVTAGNAPSAGGASIRGGGGGGACSSTAGGTRTGGTSMSAGGGGAGGLNTGGNGTNGTAPGGGGGGAVQGGTSGSGARGEVRVRGIC